jgi:hypothetical protein
MHHGDMVLLTKLSDLIKQLLFHRLDSGIAQLPVFPLLNGYGLQEVFAGAN